MYIVNNSGATIILMLWFNVTFIMLIIDRIRVSESTCIWLFILLSHYKNSAFPKTIFYFAVVDAAIYV